MLSATTNELRPLRVHLQVHEDLDQRKGKPACASKDYLPHPKERLHFDIDQVTCPDCKRVEAEMQLWLLEKQLRNRQPFTVPQDFFDAVANLFFTYEQVAVVCKVDIGEVYRRIPSLGTNLAELAADVVTVQQLFAAFPEEEAETCRRLDHIFKARIRNNYGPARIAMP